MHQSQNILARSCAHADVGIPAVMQSGCMHHEGHVLPMSACQKAYTEYEGLGAQSCLELQTGQHLQAVDSGRDGGKAAFGFFCVASIASSSCNRCSVYG
jgi:hypothetical protein